MGLLYICYRPIRVNPIFIFLFEKLMSEIIVKQVTYVHADRESLFQNISFSVPSGSKVALIGNNGSGKSTLLKIIARELLPESGEIIGAENVYYIPQHMGQFNDWSVAEALRVDRKIKALRAILAGDAGEYNFTVLGDDWEIEERSYAALTDWDLSNVYLEQKMSSLSGGEKTRVFLAGIQVHSPDVILLDEPTNHLDKWSRGKLYDLICLGRATVLVVSHDRVLLNRLFSMLELGNKGITLYGGNFDFYKEQKEMHLNALREQVEEKQKELRLAKKIAREAAERQQKREVRGEKQSLRKGIPRIMMNTLKNKAERCTSKLSDVHAEKIDSISTTLSESRASLSGVEQMKVDFNSSQLHEGKILISADGINFGYQSEMLWEEVLTFQIKSGERVGLDGRNGSGKTTLLKLLLGQLEPTKGTLTRADFKYVYVDQECSILRNELTVYEQAECFNEQNFPEHELKMRLNRFLFPREVWDKPCYKLSGGERMRLVFCCLMIGNNTPDVFVLDEPTNNLDILNIEIITSAIKDFRGTVIAVSHDRYFMEEIMVNRYILDSVSKRV